MSEPKLPGAIAFDKATTKCLAYLLNYDSDTFFAAGARLTEDEAWAILAERLEFIVDEVDGTQLTEILMEIRNVEDSDDLYA